jgi:integrase
MRPLDRDEAKRFLEAAELDRHHALYVLGLTSGMRLGEIGGCSDLDLDLGVLRVRRALVTGYGQTLEAPKTPNSRRSVVLTRTAAEAPLRHRERQAAQGFPWTATPSCSPTRWGDTSTRRTCAAVRSSPS